MLLGRRVVCQGVLDGCHVGVVAFWVRCLGGGEPMGTVGVGEVTAVVASS